MADSMEVSVEETTDRHLMSVDSIKVMAESIGISNLNEEVCKRMTEEIEFRLKEVVQNGIKFMRHSKRNKFMCSDIDNALRSKNVEPLYGFECSEYIPLRHSSGGGKEIFHPEEQEIDLVNIISSPLPRLPCEVTLRSHWLAVEGVQPSVPENVPPLSLEQQKKQAVALSLNKQDSTLTSKDVRMERKRKKESDSSTSDWIKLKPLQPHIMTQEQQFYYKELTDACVGLSDNKRQEALTSISTDSSLCQLLPQLVTFVTEGIKVNVAQRRLTYLKNLLKVVNALLENTSVSVDRFLHELIPSVCTCLLNRQLCSRPESEDHWSLRDMAAKIVALICKRYSNSVNNIQTRLTRTFSQILQGGIQQGLAPQYGAVVAFGELGQSTIAACVIPRLKQIGEHLKMVQISLTGTTKVIEQVAANKLQSVVQRYCSSVLQQSRPATDTLAMYQQDYGYLGTGLFNQVKSLRQGRPTLTLSSLQKISSPTSPKTKLSPLTLTSPPVTATKITTSKGNISLGSPSGNVRLQINSPTAGTSGVATIPVTLLSAVVNNSTVVQALANQLGGGTVSTSATLSSVVSTLQEHLSSTSTSKVSTSNSSGSSSSSTGNNNT